MANTYVLDSTVAVLVLDGELWEREPYLLVSHDEDLLLQLEKMLLELELKSPMLKQSLHLTLQSNATPQALDPCS